MTNQPSSAPDYSVEAHESRFGWKPQALQPVMDPWHTPCGGCGKPLMENVGQASDYLFFEGDQCYYHRKCLAVRVENIYVKPEGGD